MTPQLTFDVEGCFAVTLEVATLERQVLIDVLRSPGSDSVFSNVAQILEENEGVKFTGNLVAIRAVGEMAARFSATTTGEQSFAALCISAVLSKLYADLTGHNPGLDDEWPETQVIFMDHPPTDT